MIKTHSDSISEVEIIVRGRITIYCVTGVRNTLHSRVIKGSFSRKHEFALQMSWLSAHKNLRYHV